MVGDYEPYTIQLNVNTVRGPPTRGRFARRTVDFVERFIVSIPDRPGAFAIHS